MSHALQFEEFAKQRIAARDGSMFLAVSVALHAVLIAALNFVEPVAFVPKPRTSEQSLMQQSLAKAETMHLQRRVAALEATLQELSGKEVPPASERPAMPTDAAELMRRAQEATKGITREAERKRAEELSKLLGIPMQRAMEKVKAENREDAKPANANTEAQNGQLPSNPERQLEAFEQRARIANAQEEARNIRKALGTAVTSQRAAGGTSQGAGNGLERGGGAGSGGSGGGRLGEGGGGEGGGASGTYFDPRQFTAQKDVDVPAALRIGEGRRIGAGGQFADRVYLDTWYLIGPFQGDGPGSMERIYPPETGVDLDAVYPGKGGRALRWRYLKAASYPIVPEPFAENAVFYAVTDVFSDIDRDVWIDIGADDDTKLWVNDKLVWTHGTGTKPWYQQAFTRMHAELAKYALVEATQRIHLCKGANRLMLKHYNGCCLTFFSVVLRP